MTAGAKFCNIAIDVVGTNKYTELRGRMDRAGLSVVESTPTPVAGREDLRRLVDIVWQHATESTAVPSTKTADKLIDRAAPPPPPSPTPFNP